MSTFESRALLAETNRLKRKAVGDQRLSSVPLFVFAGIVGVGATLEYARFRPATPDLLARWDLPWSGIFYEIVVPVVLAGVFLAQRRRARRLGTDPIGGWSAGIALVLVHLLLQTFVRSGLGSWGSVAAAVGILAAAIVQRNWFLAAWISVLGVVALLLEDFFWANRLSELRNWLSGYQDPRFGYADFTQYIAIAGVLAFILGIAAWALRREWVR